MTQVIEKEDLEHPDRPDSDSTGAEWGRRMADEVVEKTLSPYGGEKPSPVITRTGPVGRYGDEGEDGSE